jgi:hypothetical protein
MKHPAHLPNNLLTQGPLFEGEVYPDEVVFLNAKNGESGGVPIRVKLLVDTGSNISGLDKRVISQLKLRRYAEPAVVRGVGGHHHTGRFRCILFLDIFGMKGLPLDVLEGDFSQCDYDGVMGRDVLRFCQFSYNGPTNRFSLKALDF